MKREDKNFIFILAVICFVSFTTISFVFAFSGDGSGTMADPFEITNWSQLQEMNLNHTAFYVLANNLNESTDGYDDYASSSANGGSGWLPIGNNSVRFNGTFDGQGKSISGLYISRSTSYVGLFGYNIGNISNVSLVDVNVTGGGDGGVASLAGINNGRVYFSSATGSVSGVNAFISEVGGLVGANTGGVIESFANVTVFGGIGAGGLVGHHEGGFVNNSYALGPVEAGFLYPGGLIGSIESGAEVYNSYSVGLITGDSPGGLVGACCNTSAAPILNSYWDNETSGQSTSRGGTGLPTAQMKNETVFTDAGWDFDTIWTINSTNNDGYPYLLWQVFASEEEEEADTTSPTISLSKASSTKNTIEVSYSCSDSGSGVLSCVLSSSSGSVSGSTISGLNCDRSYDVSVSAQDVSGNNASRSVSMSTEDCGGYSPRTFSAESNEISEGYSQLLRVGDQYSFSVVGESHSMTLDSFNSTSAQVTLRSEPIILFLEKDVENLVDVNSDGTDDLLLRYEGIENWMAKIYVEEISVDSDDSAESSDGEQSSEDFESENVEYLIMVLSVIVLAGVIVVWFYLQGRKHKLRKGRKIGKK